VNFATLRTKADFDRVFAGQERFFRDGLSFRLRIAGEGLFHLGIMAPKRFGGAVERNRFRRRVRELIRTTETLPGGVELVISAQKPYQDLRFDLLRRTVGWALSRAQHLLRKDRGGSREPAVRGEPRRPVT